MSLRLPILALVIVLGAASLPAQCPAPTWWPMSQIPGLDAGPACMTTWDPDGSGPASPVLVVGGAFGTAGATLANGIVTWNGTGWQAMGTGANSYFTAVAVHNGDLVAARGTIGTTSYSVVRWNGASWVLLGAIDGWVTSFASFNGNLFAAGTFTTIGGVSASNVARWDGISWSPLGTGVNAAANALRAHNGELFAGGEFTVAGGVASAYVARWNGATWQDVGGGMDAAVLALGAWNGDLVAGGNFSSAGGSPASCVARWNGSAWSPLGGGMPTGPLGLGVRSFAVYNGDLIAGGGFTMADGSRAKHVARWDGSAWLPLGVGVGGSYGSNQGIYAAVFTMTPYNGDLVVGGTFVDAGQLEVNEIARWDGSTWSAFGPGLGSPPSSFTTWNGDLVAGSYGSYFQPAYVRRWDGTTWHPISPGIFPEVWALEVHGGELIAAGNLFPAGVTSSVARWTGSAWAPLGAGPPHVVLAMTHYNGDLIAAGLFGTQAISRWDGSSWQPLGLGGPTHRIDALAVYNGDLIAGGLFTSVVGGQLCSYVARWDGQAWFPLGSGLNSSVGSGSVSSLAVYNGELVAGGFFVEAGGIPAQRIARWNGTAWMPFASPVDGWVRNLAVYEGELVAGGVTTAGGVPVGGIARWNGSSWQPVGAGGFPLTNGYGQLVTALTVHRGALVVGGSFAAAGGAVSPYVARWSPPRPMLDLRQPSGAGTGVEVTDRWLIPGHEYYNLVSFDLAPGGVGTGPYGGLWFNNFASLLQQVLLPVGSLPIHFAAATPDVTFGPFPLPVGLAFEAISADVTGGVLGCVAPAQQFVVY